MQLKACISLAVMATSLWLSRVLLAAKRSRGNMAWLPAKYLRKSLPQRRGGEISGGESRRRRINA